MCSSNMFAFCGVRVCVGGGLRFPKRHVSPFSCAVFQVTIFLLPYDAQYMACLLLVIQCQDIPDLREIHTRPRDMRFSRR